MTDETQEQPRRGPGRPRKHPKVTVSNRGADIQEQLQSGQTDVQGAADIIRQRLESSQPFTAGGSIPIKLKNPNLICRWFNAAKSADHIWRAKNRLGWLPVTPDMVVDPEQLGGANTSETGTIVRGERGMEHLLYMDKASFAKIQSAKTASNDRMLGSKRTKADIAQAASLELGDEASEWIDKHLIGDVEDSLERTTLDHSIPER